MGMDFLSYVMRLDGADFCCFEARCTGFLANAPGNPGKF